MTHAPASPRQRPFVLWAVGAGIVGAVVLSLLSTTQLYVSNVGADAHISLPRLFGMELLYWSPWLVLAPLIVLLGRQYRIGAGHLWRRLPIWLTAVFACGIICSALVTALGRGFGVAVPPVHAGAPEPVLLEIRHRFSATLAGNILVFVIAALLYHAVAYYGEYRDRAQRESELQAELARFHLHVLRAQLQPHFLFNTLNTVSALMAEDVLAARRVLANLADLLRISLDQMGRQHVRVEEEIDFLRRYVEIHLARFGDRFVVEWRVDEHVRAALLPSMVLQPCVENAIRHGVEPQSTGGRIIVAASAHAGHLVLEIEDNGPGVGHDANGQRSGVGLVNVRERLRTMYGDDHTFEAGNAPAGGFRVRMSLPLATAGLPETASR